jgi:pyruvate-ferredoxin/flavodoxin oxidoreductase
MRYNPIEEKLYMDSPIPNFDKYDEFLNGEIRYRSLAIKDKELAAKLLTQNKEEAIKRYNYYNSLATK